MGDIGRTGFLHSSARGASAIVEELASFAETKKHCRLGGVSIIR